MKSIWAIMMVKDEEDIVGFTIDHLISQGITGFLIYDNMSTDKTFDILQAKMNEKRVPIILIEDREPAYFQAEKTTRLFNMAKNQYGAGWVMPVDADELIYDNNGRTIAEVLSGLKDEAIAMPWYYHYATDADDQLEVNPYKRIQWREKTPSSLCKIVCGTGTDKVIAQGNHAAYNMSGDMIPARIDSLVVRHFPHRSEKQFCRKMINGGKAYAAGGDRIPENFGVGWRMYYNAYLEHGESGLRWIWGEHYFIKSPDKVERLIHDPAPFGR